jgi:hypothetical protein
MHVTLPLLADTGFPPIRRHRMNPLQFSTVCAWTRPVAASSPDSGPGSGAMSPCTGAP